MEDKNQMFLSEENRRRNSLQKLVLVLLRGLDKKTNIPYPSPSSIPKQKQVGYFRITFYTQPRITNSYYFLLTDSYLN